MNDEQRQSSRVPVQMNAEILMLGRDGESLCDPVKVMVADLSANGISLCLASMRVEGQHLFYGVQDESGSTLVLRFADNKGRRYAITCRPVWFNKELDEEPMYYRLGLAFTKEEEKEQIRFLQSIAKGREKTLTAILGEFFRKQLIRAS